MVRILAALVVAVVAFAFVASVLDDRLPGRPTPSDAGLAAIQAEADGALVVEVGEFDLSVGVGRRERWRAMGASDRRRAIERWVRRARQGAVEVTLDGNAADLQRIDEAVMGETSRVAVRSSVVGVALVVPRIRQSMRNNCETASLSMLLRGRRSQDALQAALPIAQPIIPGHSPSGAKIWGDPQLGFVGRVRGGGYGVYDRPLFRLTRRFDRGAENLTGRPFADVVAALRAGRPVVVWLARGRSRPMMWRTPAGRQVAADAAEHAVLLVGWQKDGTLAYHDPLDGRRYEVGARALERRWRLLGGRAIAGSRLTNGGPSNGNGAGDDRSGSIVVVEGATT